VSWFLQPDALPVLVLVPVAAFVFWLMDRRGRTRFAWIAGARAQTRPSRVRRRVHRVLFCVALFFASVAFLQPAWGKSTRSVEQRGVDIVVCLDVSRSMLARDVAPDRLRRAHGEIEALAKRAAGDRLGLVVFAGEARLAVPLTRDLGSFARLAVRADPLSVGRGGTDLGAALTTALTALEGGSGEHEAIVVVTDGEDLEEKGLRAAARCKERGITVHCVGLGSARGAKIPVRGVDGAETYVRDRAGADVVSVMDPATLSRIAESTGGAFVRAPGDDRPLLDLYEREIVPMARKSFAAREQRARENRYQWPLLLAFCVWILELGWRRR